MCLLRINQNVCTNLERASQLEWLETNGLGGFASSTITGLNTRRYHGLLTAALGHSGRRLLLSKLEETLVVDERRYDLSVNQYPGAVHPQGYRYLCEFRLDPFPVSIYQIEGFEIEKRVFLVHGENTVVVEYELRSLERDPLPEVRLELRPLIAFRDYHSTTHRNPALREEYEAGDGRVRFRPYEEPLSLELAHTPAAVERAGDWYLNFEYAVERERGLDYREDLFNPCVLKFDFRNRSTAAIVATTGSRAAADIPALRRQETERRASLLASAPDETPLARQLTLAADQFIVERGSAKSIIAGYPWFTDWGRDAMIALPGLTLTTKRYADARAILRAFAASADQGMLPNRFPDAGEQPEYNTVDATLWFFEAVRAYFAATGDVEFVRDEMYPVLCGIVDWHFRGTRYGIRVEDSGLLRCGEPGVQLTWMDAKIGDWVVTPRSGHPVEVQALWYNALRTMEDFHRRFGNPSAAQFLQEFSGMLRRNFLVAFWNPATGCLFDVVDGEDRDASIRPNQIFAVSLHHSMLEDALSRMVVDTVEDELLTPFGLRTLSPRDPRYRSAYEGGVYERDSAYHQGTVWPWLLGPFLTAYLKTCGGSEAARRQASAWLKAIEVHLAEAGLMQISEIADADSPHRPRGCFAQAWSVAECLRVAVELAPQVDRRRMHDPWASAAEAPGDGHLRPTRVRNR